MAKKLTLDVTSFKFEDNETDLKFRAIQNGVIISDSALSATIKIKQADVGYIKSVSAKWVDKYIVISSGDLSDLPVGSYLLELWLGSPSGYEIYPDSGFVRLYINQNATGISGNLISSITLGEFQKQFSDLSKEVNNKIDDLYAQTDSNTSNIEINTSELSDMRTGYDGYLYETAGEAIRNQFKLMEKTKIGFVSNKNLFDDTTVTSGYYVNYANGNLTANANFSASDFISVESDSVYTISNQNNDSVYPKNLDLTQMAFYDSTKKYISGMPNSGIEANGSITFTTPENAEYFRFSLYPNQLNYQLEKGSSKTDYVRHRMVAPIDKMPDEIINAVNFANSQTKNYVIVSKTGGDYNSILRALKNTPPEIEIRIKGGTYNLYDEYIEFYGADFWTNYTNYANHTDDPFYRGLHLEPGRKLFGDANTIVTFDAGTNQVSADVAPYWSILATTWNCEAHNIHFRSPVDSAIRYIVHDDFSPYGGFGTTLYQDCTFDGSCYGKAQIGGGFGTDMFYKFDNCQFINNVYIHDISYHSRVSNYDIPPCKVIVSNCVGTQRCAFRWMGKSTNISYCTVNNSKFNTIVCIPYDENATVKNMELVEWNNTKTVV